MADWAWVAFAYGLVYGGLLVYAGLLARRWAHLRHRERSG